MKLGPGLYVYFALVLAFSIGIVCVFSLSHRRTEYFSEYGPKDGDVVVNVSLIARSLHKELGKLAKALSKNISSFK